MNEIRTNAFDCDYETQNYYSLDIENDIHGSMLNLHERLHSQISSLDFWLGFLPADDENYADIARGLAERESQALKVGQYLRKVGLLEDF